MVRTRDCLVNAEELAIDGESFEPSSDDRIIEELDVAGTTKQWLFDVIKLPGKGTFEWCDQNRVRMRVFTQLRATV